jgi:hypothetical protein
VRFIRVLEHVDENEVAEAFDTWAKRYQEHPEEFEGEEFYEGVYGDSCARYLFDLLRGSDE